LTAVARGDSDSIEVSAPAVSPADDRRNDLIGVVGND
jgi:hypothetical protein